MTAAAVVPDRVQAPFGARRAPITELRRLGAYTVLHCADPAGPRPVAGQFYMLMAAERWGGGQGERPFLPRAFSVLRAPPGGPELQFLIEDVGPGTRRLCELSIGDALSLVGPLGNGFSAPQPGRRPLLVGGGVGIAPLAILGDQLGAGAGPDKNDVAGPGAVETMLGFRDQAHAPAAKLIDGARIATDDGSAGHHGLITELLAGRLAGDLAIGHEVYACGPPPMLESVRRLCVEHDVPAQLALESGMACGFGACFGCVVSTRQGYLRLCVDGPVLPAGILDSALTPGAGH